jgi:hypothetical protein
VNPVDGDPSDPDAVVESYFTAIRERDGGALRRLFAPEAELVAAGTTVRGTDAIAEFYETGAFGYDDLWPRPGPLEIDGGRVTVVIDLRMGGTDHTVADTFEVSGGKIARLEIAFLPAGPA